ncbi:MAG: PH domain-containing protein [Candidatus Micrarchaeia archaeon]
MNDKHYLYDRIKLVWMMPAILAVIILWSIIFLGTYFYDSLFRTDANTVPYGIAMTIVILLADYVFVELKYMNYYYEFKDQGLRISHGILEKRIDEIPYSKIQHVRAERTIFENLLGLVHIHVEMAGVSHSESQPSIPGVPIEAYEEMIEFIKSRGSIDTNNPETYSVYCPPTKSQEELLRLVLEELKIMNRKLSEMGKAKHETKQEKKPLKMEDTLSEENIRTHL